MSVLEHSFEHQQLFAFHSSGLWLMVSDVSGWVEVQKYLSRNPKWIYQANNSVIKSQTNAYFIEKYKLKQGFKKKNKKPFQLSNIPVKQE